MNDQTVRVRLLQKQVWREGLVSLRFEKPEKFSFTPGQFVRLGLNIEQNGSSEYAARAYSIVSTPNDPFLEFFLVSVPGGLVSPRLTSLEAGSFALLQTEPMGSLTADRIPGNENLWCLSTGTGLAPFLSILREESVWKKWPTVVLVHCVRLSEDLVYTRLIEEIKKNSALGGGKDRNLIYLPIVTREATQFLSKRIPTLISSGELQDTASVRLDKTASSVLLCGNPAMVKEARAILKPMGFQAPRRNQEGNLIAENLWQE